MANNCKIAKDVQTVFKWNLQYRCLAAAAAFPAPQLCQRLPMQMFWRSVPPAASPGVSKVPVPYTSPSPCKHQWCRWGAGAAAPPSPGGRGSLELGFRRMASHQRSSAPRWWLLGTGNSVSVWGHATQIPSQPLTAEHHSPALDCNLLFFTRAWLNTRVWTGGTGGAEQVITECSAAIWASNMTAHHLKTLENGETALCGNLLKQLPSFLLL